LTREDKEEETQSKICYAVPMGATKEPQETNLKSTGPELDINLALAQMKITKPSDNPTATAAEAQWVEKSHSVSSLSDGARVGNNALIQKLRAEAERGEEGCWLGTRTSILGKRADRAQAEREEDEDSYSFEVIVSNKKFRGAILSEMEEGKEGKDGGQEATSPGAAGQLTGASVGACQEP
jgi:hypothetical protein